MALFERCNGCLETRVCFQPTFCQCSCIAVGLKANRYGHLRMLAIAIVYSCASPGTWLEERLSTSVPRLSLFLAYGREGFDGLSPNGVSALAEFELLVWIHALDPGFRRGDGSYAYVLDQQLQPLSPARSGCGAPTRSSAFPERRRAHTSRRPSRR